MFSKTKQLSRLSYPRQRLSRPVTRTRCSNFHRAKLLHTARENPSVEHDILVPTEGWVTWRSHPCISCFGLSRQWLSNPSQSSQSSLSKQRKWQTCTNTYKNYQNIFIKIEYLLGNLKPTFRTGANLVAWTSRDHATHCAGRTPTAFSQSKSAGKWAK
jgi:hypothetical protein